MIKVLVVDDSTVVRKIIIGILEKHPEIEVRSAKNGAEALEMIPEYNPDVVTLDIEMPVMDGIRTLRTIMEKYPRPVIMLSAQTGKGTMESVECLRLGAVDCIPKINSETVFLGYIETELIARILYFGNKENYVLYSKRLQEVASPSEVSKNNSALFSDKLILIGASTGGPLVLQHILSSIKQPLSSSIIIALHMPKGFSASFVERLGKLCTLPVRLIEDKDPLLTQTIYVCCGGYQTILQRQNDSYMFHVFEDKGEYPYKPSVDVLFSSIAEIPGLSKKTMGLILTGMGQDGLLGCRKLHEKDIPIYAQDEKSSVVFGMPKAVIQDGIATEIPLDSISNTIEKFGK